MSERVSGVASTLWLSRELLDRTQLDRAVHCAGTAASRFNRIVDIGDVKKVVTSEPFLRLREWPIGRDGFAAGCADRRGGGGWLQGGAGHEPALLG